MADCRNPPRALLVVVCATEDDLARPAERLCSVRRQARRLVHKVVDGLVEGALGDGNLRVEPFGRLLHAHLLRSDARACSRELGERSAQLQLDLGARLCVNFRLEIGARVRYRLELALERLDAPLQQGGSRRLESLRRAEEELLLLGR